MACAPHRYTGSIAAPALPEYPVREAISGISRRIIPSHTRLSPVKSGLSTPRTLASLLASVRTLVVGLSSVRSRHALGPTKQTYHSWSISFTYTGFTFGLAACAILFIRERTLGVNCSVAVRLWIAVAKMLV